jgi:hypothetical protein
MYSYRDIVTLKLGVLFWRSRVDRVRANPSEAGLSSNSLEFRYIGTILRRIVYI